MTYRGTLFGTRNVNGTEIVGFIQDWVNTNPLIMTDNNQFARVDSNCPVVISSLNDPYTQKFADEDV